MHIQFFKYFTILLFSIFLVSCGSESSKSSPVFVTGTFVDSPVSGLSYSCSSTVDIYKTDENGKFTCQVWDDITFSLSDLVAGKLRVTSETITPYSLFPNDNLAAINLATLLQSLNSSSDDNFLTLNKDLLAKLPNDINFSAPTFRDDIEKVLDLKLVEQKTAKGKMDKSIKEHNGVVPETPILATLITSIVENASENSIVGNLPIIDNGTTPISSIILNGLGNANFNISTTGEITVAVHAVLDYETSSSFSLTAVAHNEAGDSNEATIIISILDVNETSAPLLQNSLASVEENSPSGTVVGDVTIVDSGSSPIDSIALSGEGHSNFTVSTTGTITTTSSASLDYETKSFYHLIAIATNSVGHSDSVDVNIFILNVTDTPTRPTLSGTSLHTSENKTTGSTVGNIPIVDEGSSSISSFTLSGNGAYNFTVCSSGVVSISNESDIDYEREQHYQLTAIATNNEGNSNSVNVTIYIDDYTNPFLIAKVEAKDFIEKNHFGMSVDVDGDYSVIGTHSESTKGSAYLYKKDSTGTVTQIALIETSDSNASVGDMFGYSVAISGNYILVGAPYNDTNASESGAVYLFKRNSDAQDDVSQIAKLTASSPDANDQFGFTVDIDGDYLLIGSPLDDISGTDEGRAYLFKRNSDSTDDTVELLTIHADTINDYDNFASSVSLNGNYMSIGSTGYNSNGGVYIMKRESDNNVTQLGVVEASDKSTGDRFGYSTSLDNPYFIVGSDSENTDSNGESIYLFKIISDSNISEISRIEDDNVTVGDHFGHSVSISGNYIVGGTYSNDATTAYIFKRNSDASDGTEEIKKIQANTPNRGDYFSNAVTIDGNLILAGTMDEGIKQEGHAYFFDLEPLDRPYIYNASDTIYTEEKYINPEIFTFEAASPVGGNIDFSLESLTTEGESENDFNDFSFTNADLFFVSTVSENAPIDFEEPQDDDEDNIYSFTLVAQDSQNNSTSKDINVEATDKYYLEMAREKASDAAAYDAFANVDISGDYIIVGAPYSDLTASNAGSAYLLKKEANNAVTELIHLQADDAEENDYFGGSVAINGDYIVIGSKGEDSNESNAGSVYIFKRDDDSHINQIAKLQANDPQEDAYFGSSVNINGDYIIIGTPKNDIDGNADQGSAYIFKRESDSNISQIAKLTIDGGQTDDLFGTSVAINGDDIAIGAIKADATNNDVGVVYLFRRNNDNDITEVDSAVANDETTDDEFGYSVDINGSYIVVGANKAQSLTGKAYLYKFDINGIAFIQQFNNANISSNHLFGSAVSIEGDSLFSVVVGAPGNFNAYDNGYNPTSYIFQVDSYDDSVRLVDKLQTHNDSENKKFGHSVAVDGEFIVIGASGDDDVGTDSGSIHIFIKDPNQDAE